MTDACFNSKIAGSDSASDDGGQQLKNVTDPSARDELLRKALQIVGKTSIENKKVLLFDDIYRSGSTLKVATDLLYRKGKAREVCGVTHDHCFLIRFQEH